MAFVQTPKPKVLILGGGVVGLNTALRLQDDLPDCQLTLMAESVGQDCVSNVAAGIFRPSASIRGPSADLTKQWIKSSWNYYQNLRENQPCGQTGIIEVSILIDLI